MDKKLQYQFIIVICSCLQRLKFFPYLTFLYQFVFLKVFVYLMVEYNSNCQIVPAYDVEIMNDIVSKSFNFNLITAMKFFNWPTFEALSKVFNLKRILYTYA